MSLPTERTTVRRIKEQYKLRIKSIYQTLEQEQDKSKKMFLIETIITLATTGYCCDILTKEEMTLWTHQIRP